MTELSFFHAGTRERKIPYPTSDPMTKLFDFVSCPNYTYEVSPSFAKLKLHCILSPLCLQTGAWLGFTIMAQSVPGTYRYMYMYLRNSGKRFVNEMLISGGKYPLLWGHFLSISCWLKVYHFYCAVCWEGVVGRWGLSIV